MKEEELRQFVAEYLESRGYSTSQLNESDERVSRARELVVTEMMRENACIGNYIAYYNSIEGKVSRYAESYGGLRDFIAGTLDLYKPTLKKILWPLFIHSYVEMVERGYSKEAKEFFQTYKDDHVQVHYQEINHLSGITTIELLKESEIVKNYLASKYTVRMDRISFELLISHLQDMNYMLLLSMINTHVNIRVQRAGASVSAGGDDDADGGTVDEDSRENDEDAEELDGDLVGRHQATSNQALMIGLLRPSEYSVMESEERLNFLADVGRKAAKLKQEKEQKKAREENSMDIDGLEGTVFDVVDQGKSPKKRGRKRKQPMEVPEGVRESERDRGHDQEDFGDSEKGKEGTDSEEKQRDLEEVKKLIETGDEISTKIPLPSLEDRVEMQRLKAIRLRASQSARSLPSTLMYTFHDTYESLVSVEMSEPTSLILAGFSDSSLRMWDFSESEEALPLRMPGHSGPIYNISLSPDDRFALTCSEDNTVRLWSLDTRTNVVCYRGHNFPIWDVKFSGLGFYFATASHDRTAKLWSTERTNPLRVFSGHDTDVNTVEFHPNCQYVATGSTDKTIRLWDVQTGECMRLFMGHNAPVHALAFSPCGRYLASGSDDSNIRFWDLATSKNISTLKGHKGAVYSIDFSKDGNILASGGQDNTVRLWDAFAAKGSTSEEVRNGEKGSQSGFLLSTCYTKATPVYKVKYTLRNVLLAAGPSKATTKY